MEHGIETLKTIDVGDKQFLLQRVRKRGQIAYQIVMLEGEHVVRIQGAQFSAFASLMEAYTADQTRLSIDGELDAVEQEKSEYEYQRDVYEQAKNRINAQSHGVWPADLYQGQLIGGASAGQLSMTAQEYRDQMLERAKELRNAGAITKAEQIASKALNFFNGET